MSEEIVRTRNISDLIGESCVTASVGPKDRSDKGNETRKRRDEGGRRWQRGFKKIKTAGRKGEKGSKRRGGRN